MTTSGTATATLETPDFPAEESAASILTRFDSLAAGERLRLRSSAPPRRLLEQLQEHRKGAFEWSLVEKAPAGWVIEVFRRDEAAGRLREVGEALAWDHDRLDALESEAFAARGAGDLHAAAARYAAFACGLNRHIGFEEEILFPAFEEKTGMDPTCGPTAVMRLEHGEIRFLLETIGQSVADPASDVLALRRRFHEVLSEHNEKEEVILYPGMDGMLRPEESDALFARIQAYGM